jgi:ribosome-associated heat shock protein Hsp15
LSAAAAVAVVADAPQRLRVDKWLWAARFYKTRSLATQAVEAGRARVNGERVKPARELKAGDEVEVRSGELRWVVAVRALSARRGPATQAALLYAEGEESRAKRELMIAARRSGPHPAADANARGRPTKRDRRLIHRFTGG